MENLNYNLLTQHHRSVLNANIHPYGYCSTSNFFPREVIQSISTSFKFPETFSFSETFSTGSTFLSV